MQAADEMSKASYSFASPQMKNGAGIYFIKLGRQIQPTREGTHREAKAHKEKKTEWQPWCSEDGKTKAKIAIFESSPQPAALRTDLININIKYMSKFYPEY